MSTFSTRKRRALGRVWGPALAGALAAGVAIAASELVAGVVRGTPSLVVAIGSLVISLQPPGAKDLMVNLFGTNDKLALNVAVVVVALVIAAAAGILAARRRSLGVAVFVAFGLLAGAAALRDPLAVAGARGRGRRGRGHGGRRRPARPPRARGRSSRPRTARTIRPPAVDSAEWTRRRFLIASAGTLGGVVVAGGAGRFLLDEEHADAVVSSSKIPAPLLALPPLAADQSLHDRGPDPDRRAERRLLQDRHDAPRPAGGPRHVEAGRQGHGRASPHVHLRRAPRDAALRAVRDDRLRQQPGRRPPGRATRCGPACASRTCSRRPASQPGATQIVGRSVDGFTVGFPTAWAMAPGREPMIARRHEPRAAAGRARLPGPPHRARPLRLRRRATKWLAEIELTTREAVDGYWIPLGWAKDAPILTQSRIDVPSDGATVRAGVVEIAGVAWAPDRGITAVEVRVDAGAWQAARISRPISSATWVQWTLPWTATPGTHTLEVRATDGTGDVQTDQRSDPAPDGARGHHQVLVNVA